VTWRAICRCLYGVDSAKRLRLLTQADVAALEAAHAEEKATILQQWEALRAVVVDALGEEGVAEALGRAVQVDSIRTRVESVYGFSVGN